MALKERGEEAISKLNFNIRTLTATANKQSVSAWIIHTKIKDLEHFIPIVEDLHNKYRCEEEDENVRADADNEYEEAMLRADNILDVAKEKYRTLMVGVGEVIPTTQNKDLVKERMNQVVRKLTERVTKLENDLATLKEPNKIQFTGSLTWLPK